MRYTSQFLASPRPCAMMFIIFTLLWSHLTLDTEVEMSGKATVALGEDGSVVILEPSDSQ
jgi:hypothetical protein